MERWLIFLGVGTLLLAAGLAIPYASFNRDVTSEYWVDVTAPDDLSWTLWLPEPLIPMTVRPVGEGGSLQEIDTSRGPFYNVSGTGNAGLAGSSQRSVFDTNLVGWEGEQIRLSGPDPGGGFWVFRQTGNASATMGVRVGSSWRASHLGGSMDCAGPSFQGNPTEGWTVLPPLLGGCDALIDGIPWLLNALALGVTGVVSLALAAVSRHRRGRRRGEQVFLPPPA